MVADLRPGEVVVAEKIDRISRLPLPDAEKLIASIRAKGAKLAIPGLVDLSELAAGAGGVANIFLESVQELAQARPEDGSGRLRDKTREAEARSRAGEGRG